MRIKIKKSEDNFKKNKNNKQKEQKTFNKFSEAHEVSLFNLTKKNITYK